MTALIETKGQGPFLHNDRLGGFWPGGGTGTKHTLPMSSVNNSGTAYLLAAPCQSPRFSLDLYWMGGDC